MWMRKWRSCLCFEDRLAWAFRKCGSRTVFFLFFHKRSSSSSSSSSSVSGNVWCLGGRCFFLERLSFVNWESEEYTEEKSSLGRVSVSSCWRRSWR